MENDVGTLVQSWRTQYGDVHSFRIALGELAEAAQLNMAKDWEKLTADLWANGQCCTCQTRKVVCPCLPGVQAAKDGGECFCGLFIGHDVDGD